MSENILSGMTTLAGSIPMKDAESAVREVFGVGLDIPAWPQLPRRSFRELMMPQYAEGLPFIKFDEAKKRISFDSSVNRAEELNSFYERYFADDPMKFAISEESAAGFYAFVRELKKRSAEGERWPLIKGQITGPFTFSFGVMDQTGKPCFHDVDLLDVIIKNLVMNARWQAKVLGEFCDRVMIFIDEPILTAFGSSAYIGLSREEVIKRINEIVEPLHKENVLVGLHCCGGTDWTMFTESELDIINFDAFQFGETLALYPDHVGLFLERGGFLAWGIVTTSKKISTETPDTLFDRLTDRMRHLVSKGVDSERLSKQAFLTPSCGTGSLSEEMSWEVAQKLVEVGKLYKASL